MSKVPVPLLLCGKIEGHIVGMMRGLLPDCDVIHNVRSVEAAESEIPALLKGEPVQPSSGFGSNYKSSDPVSGSQIKAVVIGGGFTAEESQVIQKLVNHTKPLAIFRADTARAPPGPPRGPPPTGPATAIPGPPPVELIKERLLRTLKEAKNEETGEWSPGVYLF